MGSEEEKDSIFTPKLPLLSHAEYYIQSPERSGMLTPPLHAVASVPFRWEEQPGKPKPCTEILNSNFSDEDFAPKCLELPPRLLLDAKINSPTTVLEGPYMAGRGSRTLSSSSFRIGKECYGSFRGITGSSGCSPEMVMVFSKRGYKGKGFLGSWKKRALKSSRGEVGGNSCVFPSNSGDRDVEYYSRELGEDNNGGSSSFRMTRIKRVGSFSSIAHSKSNFWASIYEGLKQVVPPWSKREKKKGFMG